MAFWPWKLWFQLHLTVRKPHQAQLIELDLDSSASASASDGFRKLEEVLQSIIARRAAPDWLPFLPGYSYYVPPPPPSNSLIEVLGRLSSSQLSNSRNSRDEIMAFGTNQGWPSSDYFIEGEKLGNLM
ncbi:hypothetical protein Leryth_001033 [Lithospermum erythrorhizon]|nr:hypothetical protein Leryth_001033 [Lithospermum erythrorhizon]